MFIAGSFRNKVLATSVAAIGFVWVYETTILDSKDKTVRPLLPADVTPPEPGAELNFTATAYCKGLVAAAGVAAQAGVAAADPGVLPLGSVVEIDSPDSRYDGIYTILDTGPAVQGRLIDIYMWSCHDALKFGRRPIRVTVLRLGWNPRATAPGFMDRLFRPRSRPRDAEPLPARPLPQPRAAE
jgi:3D (Asp-Asp-Asp) domain-containing protein